MVVLCGTDHCLRKAVDLLAILLLCLYFFLHEPFFLQHIVKVVLNEIVLELF